MPEISGRAEILLYCSTALISRAAPVTSPKKTPELVNAELANKLPILPAPSSVEGPALSLPTGMLIG